MRRTACNGIRSLQGSTVSPQSCHGSPFPAAWRAARIILCFLRAPCQICFSSIYRTETTHCNIIFQQNNSPLHVPSSLGRDRWKEKTAAERASFFCGVSRRLSRTTKQALRPTLLLIPVTIRRRDHSPHDRNIRVGERN